MPDVFRSLPESFVYNQVHSSRWKKRLLSTSIEQPLDRVNVLGDENSGHTGWVYYTHDDVSLVELT